MRNIYLWKNIILKKETLFSTNPMHNAFSFNFQNWDTTKREQLQTSN